MSDVRLTGQLLCRSDEDVRIVMEHLPDHVERTRAEPGCLRFVVVRGDDPLVWQVDEVFTDEAAFEAHQVRVASSAWGRATAGIERRYVIEGLSD